MGHGEFLWCDLATFGANDALKFYGGVFRWRFTTETFPDGSVYHYATHRDDVTAGIYEMPEIYRDAGMPSFWMTYVGVDEISPSIDLATKLGGRLILGPASFGAGAAIAMLEDPLGARFTIFTGNHLQPRRRNMVDGSHAWDELLTPDVEAATAFYGELFNWKFDPPDTTGRRLVRNLALSITSEFRPVPADAQAGVAGWKTGFATTSARETIAATLKVGGREMNVPGLVTRDEHFLADQNGSIFAIKEIGQRRTWLD